MVASLKAGDSGLGHLEPLTEFCLREVVVDAVGDHALRDRAGERGAVPLLAERRVFDLLEVRQPGDGRRGGPVEPSLIDLCLRSDGSDTSTSPRRR